MRWLLRTFVALVLVVVLATGFSFVASESGEVVVLKTKSAGASAPDHETRVWVVDEGGKQWLRAGDPKSTWLAAIQRDPAVEVSRGGQNALYTAVPDAASRDRLNELFAAKYGWADAYIGALFGRDDATPIRLDPR